MEWFETWFDSPYYHQLYRHRDDTEARIFIDRLLSELEIKNGAKALDLACGKGRHARYLESKGLNVIGVDLSNNSISAAREFESDTLQFFVHDMRNELAHKDFNYIFNFFTSFGYFADIGDNLKTLKSVSNALVPGGTFIMDYMNADRARHSLISEEEQRFGDVRFIINRFMEEENIVKEIEVIDTGFNETYRESVRAFSLNELTGLFEAAGLKVLNVWGDYALGEYNPDNSSRMILHAAIEL